MPRHRGASASGQQLKAVAQPRGQPTRPKQVDPRDRELDRKRNAVKTAAQIGHDRHVGIVELEVVVAGNGALDEQADSGERHRLLGGEAGGCRRDRQRTEPIHPFAFGTERLATCCKDVDARGGPEQLFCHCSCGSDHVLAIVEDDHHVLLRQKCPNCRHRIVGEDRKPERGG
ncbi:hypothetical protein ACQR1W_23735 [Bradyrhizobium sp. HKCCYLS1011]|uniref:hypothetical protein n=1 Tax=Bradyrhizobium sp. HKCCYLS1011 TaxID=3420733 RepID=UPI003EBCE4FD